VYVASHKNIFTDRFWRPRKVSNLQPSVKKTDTPLEVALMISMGCLQTLLT